MPDASHFTDAEMLDRANRLRQRAADCRFIAERRPSWDEHGEYWLWSACKFDSQADIVLEAMKAGKSVPKVDFGDEPFKG